MLVGLGSSLDLVEEFRLVALKVFVIEANETGCLRINVTCQNRVVPQLSKTVEIELPRKAGEVGMLEIKRENVLSKRCVTKV